MEMRIIDETELPHSRSDRTKYAEIYKALETLPAGKWIECRVPDDTLPGVMGLSLAQAARQGRRDYKITYRTDKIRRLLYVSKVLY